MSQTATEHSSAPALRHIPRRYVALVLIIVAICLLGALVIVRDNSSPGSTSTTETLSPAPASLLATIAAVPASVFDTLESPNGREATAVAAYGSGVNSFPLVDVANRYVLNGSAFTPGALVGLTQDQIAGYLTSPTSPLTQAVVSAANEISAAICAEDGQQPTAVCGSKGVEAADDALGIAPPT